MISKTKYQVRNSLTLGMRERRVRDIQERFNSTREYAVRYIDYQNYQRGHYAIQTTAGLLFLAVGRNYVKGLTKTFPYVAKNYFYYPLLSGSFYVGWKLYDKLRGYYLNFDSTESNLHWYTDYAEKFQVKRVEKLENWEEDLSLTPMEKYFKLMEENTKELKLNQNNLVFGRYSKDRDDTYYLFGKVRNLENIAYLSEEDLKDIDSPVKLQMKLDSIQPVNPVQGLTLEQTAALLHEKLDKYKLNIENLKKLRSDKDKLLGLPFLMRRLQQNPEPNPGTWQYDLFTELYGHEYNYNIGVPETEEKINKFNYRKFLHPSVIKRFDTNSEEFEMYLRELHHNNPTQKEVLDKIREHFCIKYMPLLSFAKNKEEGRDIINYLENKTRNESYNNYLYKHYSGQDEQALFRLTEEMRFKDNNNYNLRNIQFTTINKSEIGIKPEELRDLLNNPKKKKEMVEALENTYPSYISQTYMDSLKDARDIALLSDTLENLHYDPSKEEEVNIKTLLGLQWDTTNTDEDEILNQYHIQVPAGRNSYNFPHRKVHVNFFYYDPRVDFSSYKNEYPVEGIVSVKNQRLETYNRHVNDLFMSIYSREYASPRHINSNVWIVPELDKNNEELAEKIRKRTPRERYLKDMKTTSYESKINDFLNTQLDHDTAQITEDEIDQALFESHYTKPAKENDSYKSKFKTKKS